MKNNVYKMKAGPFTNESAECFVFFFAKKKDVTLKLIKVIRINSQNTSTFGAHNSQMYMCITFHQIEEK